MSLHHTVTVQLGDRSYPIFVGEGMLEDSLGYLKPFLATKRAVILTEQTVADQYLPVLEKDFCANDIHLETIVLPSEGENLKSFNVLQEVLNTLLEKKIDRKTTLIALGGGVIGDLTGFAASIVLRGIPFIQVPTTLLSQVDSSVGGKTAINSGFGKNLIGTFYQPQAVLIDLAVLKTLPQRHLKAGLAEIIKYGLINDVVFFDYLIDGAEKILKGDSEVLAKAIRRSCELKAEIVAADEKESNVRALLNLGHTFAHAIEIEAGYDGTVLHGEAVSVGLLMAFQFSHAVGQCDIKDVERLAALLTSLQMPSKPSDLLSSVSADRFLEHMSRDKKVVDGKLRLILAKAIGQSYIEENVKEADLQHYLEKVCAE